MTDTQFRQLQQSHSALAPARTQPSGIDEQDYVFDVFYHRRANAAAAAASWNVGTVCVFDL